MDPPIPSLLGSVTFVCDGVSLTTRSAVQGGSRLCEALQDQEYVQGMRWGVLPFDKAAMQVFSAEHWDVLRLASIAVQELNFGETLGLWAAHDALSAAIDILKSLNAPDCALTKARILVGGSVVGDIDFVKGLLAAARYMILETLASRMDAQIAQAKHAVDCGQQGDASHLLHGMQCAYRTGQLVFLKEAIDHMCVVSGAMQFVVQLANAAVVNMGEVYNHTSLFYGTHNKRLCDQVQKNYVAMIDGVDKWAEATNVTRMKGCQEFSEFTLGSIPDKNLPVTVVPPLTCVEDLRPE